MEEKPEIHDEQNEMYEHFRFVADKGQAMVRIDLYLFAKIANASRNRIRNAAKAGNILVNDAAVKPSYKVKPSDVISIVLAYPPRDTEIYPENIPVHVVYEDDDVLVINKPPGMVVHPGHGNFTGTLLNALAYYYQGTGTTAYLCHRIDKDTSGILLLAKNELAQTKLAKQFFDHTIDRKYIALVWGTIKEDQGTITGNIARDPRNRLVMKVFDTDGETGRHAVTHFRVIERLGYVTLVECVLETGRTHQIRIHMKHFGHPLFNDESYGGDAILKGTTFAKYKQFIHNCFQLMPRQALHAKSLGFVHPGTRKPVMFDSELPEDFNNLLNKWRDYVKHDE
jgi:23S rRNA pseudouridine1911/1915/1917 synthase